MAELDLTLNKKADTYSDGDIENTLLELAESGFDITADENSYPFAAVYHFSPQRENILNWYPFDKSGTCLEIGAGCGAITGMLCQKHSFVTSVDISERRCKINYARHRDIENLKIIAGNIQTLKFDTGFDTVVLNGVFEYALSFIRTDTPYESLLALAKSFLNPNGRLFIAIENRIGLKYLNGAAEDHTDNYFLGMNGYAGNDAVRTFTRNELAALAKKAGFGDMRFYYPYPDYKFPTEIFTDSTVNSGFGAPYPNLNQRSFGLYSEQKMSASLCAEGVMGHFANSFLLELALDKCDRTVDYVKINSLRKPEYQIMTLLSGKNAAYKLPVTDSAISHIKNMSGREIYPKGISALQGEEYKNGVKYPYLESDSLVGVIEKCGDAFPVSSTLKAFFGKFTTEKADFITDDFKRIFGSFDCPSPLECIRPANIDLICDNIFVSNGEYIIIDGEWCFDMPVPLQFIIWRCVNELYYKNPDISAREDISSVFDSFDIDEKMINAFHSFAVHFAEEYVGLKYFSGYTRPLNQISLLDIYNERALLHSINTACYYDTGSGYSEDGKFYTDITLDVDGSFCVTFPLPAGVKSVRWDIAEGRLLKCRVDGIKKGGDVNITPDNADKNEDGFDIFITADPHYTITNLSGNSFTLCGKIIGLTLFESYAAAAKSESAFEKKLSEKDGIIAEKTKAINDSNVSAMLEKRYIKSCEQRMNTYFAGLIAAKKELDAKQGSIDSLNAQLDYYRSENTRIQNSLGWRFMSVFWRLKAKLLHRGK